MPAPLPPPTGGRSKRTATRYRGPLTRFAKAVTALAFYKKGW
ncbi:hypothetical protein ACFQ71_42240 [Streptomyces sp. NPDC056534]